MLLVLYKKETAEVIDIIPHGEVRGDEVWIGTRRVASGLNCAWAYVPDQDLSRLYQADESGVPHLVARYPDNFVLFAPEEQAALIDREIAQAINDQVHPFCPIEEQIGILHKQLALVLEALKLPKTPEFEKLEEIAKREISRREDEKSAILGQKEGQDFSLS